MIKTKFNSKWPTRGLWGTRPRQDVAKTDLAKVEWGGGSTQAAIAPSKVGGVDQAPKAVQLC